MSGFITQPPTTNSNVFNPNFYQSQSSKTPFALSGVINGTATADKAVVLNSNLDFSGIRNLKASCLLVGTSTDTNRLISALDSSMTVGTARFLTLGRSQTSKDQAELSFYYAGAGSTSNRLDFGFFGAAVMYLTAAGNLGIGDSAAAFPLTINKSITSTFASLPVEQYGQNGVNAVNQTRSISMQTSHGIRVESNGIYFMSDARVKSDIKPITDEEADALLRINPISYTENATGDRFYGVVAQDLLKNDLSLLTCINDDPKMEEMIDDDGFVSPAKYKWSVQYDRIAPILLRIVQRQDSRIKRLENRLSELDVGKISSRQHSCRFAN